MQLGGGCASGTLYTVGAGSARMIVTLFFFCTGSLIATSHIQWWFDLPHFEPISLVKSFGVVPALLLNFVLFAVIAAATVYFEKETSRQSLKLNHKVQIKVGNAFCVAHGLWFGVASS